jgi:hypothetical protein
MALAGKGFFIWKIPKCEDGNVSAIATLAEECQFSHVLVKIADTIYSYNLVDGVDLVPPLVQALHDRGIQALGWHYVKGDMPDAEANKAIQRVSELALDGYVIDAESEYKQSGKSAAARQFMSRLRAALPNTMIALSSYRYPSYHPQLPWREFLDKCDINMPQVYWLHAHNAGEQLSRSVTEFRSMRPFRPIIPTGSAFREFGWQPTPDEILDFLQTARSLDLAAANFYSWDSCRAFLPEVWDTICEYPWTAPEPPGDMTARLIVALNSHDPDRVVELYIPSAVHITGARTIQGHTAIRAWYASLFNTLLPGAIFRRTSHSGSGSSLHFNWTAASSTGNVDDGSDTLGLVNDRIAYHYSFFSVSN